MIGRSVVTFDFALFLVDEDVVVVLVVVVEMQRTGAKTKTNEENKYSF